MKRLSSLATVLAAVLVVGGCNLSVENPNAPDAKRAFADPAGLAQLLGGSLRDWMDTRGSPHASMVMDMQADNMTASWNNWGIRFYNSVGVDCPSRCGWTNSSTAAEAAGGLATPHNWYGFYTVMSSANDVAKAIAGGLCFDDNCSVDNTLTSRNKAMAKMMQGLALAGIALQYDQGFIVDETTDLSNPSALPFAPRAEVRDAAVAKLEEAWAEAGTHTWQTDPIWMGVGAGKAYTNTQIQQVIKTAEAELLAMFPRCDIACNGGPGGTATPLPGDKLSEVPWDSVAALASKGISSGLGFNFEYYIDVNSGQCGLDCTKSWGNSIGTTRTDTRVAAMVTRNQVTPWPAPNGNPCPTVSDDKRVGDGTWGLADDFNGYGSFAATANAGTDFACFTSAIFNPTRGSYHQSNLGWIRYNYLAGVGENLPQFDGSGQDPMFTTQMNDLLWAEGLIRGGGSLALAAEKINNSRVGRGGLTPLDGTEGVDSLLKALQYEQEIEFMGQGPDAFYNRRRIDGLTFSSKTGLNDQVGTPRQMPVPAKELDVLLRSVYTFGGVDKPDMVSGVGVGGVRRQTVREVFEQLKAEERSGFRQRF
jgi:hypothetical protein